MAFTDEEVQAVWEKGKTVADYESGKWRKDECGPWISRTQYGNRNSDYGWEIDHISAGGSDNLANLRPLQWQNNVNKNDGRLGCKVTASGTQNVEKK